MRVAYTNLLDSATLTPLSETAGYVVENVQDQRLSVKWVSTTATTQTVIVDLGAATSITVMAILGHNIASTSTVVVNANTADSWGAPAVTNSITWNVGPMLKFVSSQNYRYWRFSFSGLTTSAQIGRLWLGTYVTIDPSSLLSFPVTKRRDDINTYGKGRQKYSTSGGVTWRKVSMSFPASQEATLQIIQNLYDAVGTYKSFIFCNFDDLRTYSLVDPMYCSITGDIQFTHTSNMRFEYQIDLEEDL